MRLRPSLPHEPRGTGTGIGPGQVTAALVLIVLLLGAIAVLGGRASDASGADGVRMPPNPTSWQWQLSGKLDLRTKARLVDVDYETTSAAQVARLKAAGKYVVCYFDAGSWEKYRPDAEAFPKAVLGRTLDGWPGERWLDVRRLDVLAPILSARMKVCADKGFDAVEPDNVDGIHNRSGFPLTEADQLRFNRWVAAEAHRQGMAVALKNDLDQAEELVGDFDFSLLEQCAQYRECGKAKPFVDAGKLVLDAEYQGSVARACRAGRRARVAVIRKTLALGAKRRACPTLKG